MKIIIAGSRSFDNYGLLKEICSKLTKPEDEIVSGTANSADRIGEYFASENNLTLSKFPANWGKYGKSAGYKRNKTMAEYADALIAFWDGTSKGTKHMIDLAREKGLVVHIIHF